MRLERWGLLVPYGVTGRLFRGWPGGERVMPGAFTRVVTHHRSRLLPMLLVDGHHRNRAQPRAGARIGQVIQLVDLPAGLAGLLRFDDTPAGRAGWVRADTDGLSAEYLATTERYPGGVREVLAAQLHRVALVRDPGYPGARLLPLDQTVITNDTEERS